ncbi:hypothetical protein TruAng_007003 [Truncatella angustata]|nr:hypothetical protein TruAng_007003 [Truncatella angustata]
MGDLFASIRQTPRHIQLSVVALSITLVLLYHSQIYFSSDLQRSEVIASIAKAQHLYGKDYHGQSNSDINRVTNDTLGFSKILVVGLPERSDKRDAIALTSAATGFHVEFVDGVKGETIPDKAVPAVIDRQALGESNLGSWRGHMNAVRRIVEDDLESALIMEDDMDWQVFLGSQELLCDICRERSPHSDAIKLEPVFSLWRFLGRAMAWAIFPEQIAEWQQGKPEHPKYVIENDETVAPLSKVTGLVDFKKYPEFTRWVHVSGGPICTFAYALTQSGARKVLFDLSVDHLTGPFDNALASFCRDGALGNPDGLSAKCMSVTPPVFFHHKAKGPIMGDSDIQSVQNGETRKKGTTENIVWSARNNIQNLLMGTKMESQFEQ